MAEQASNSDATSSSPTEPEDILSVEQVLFISISAFIILGIYMYLSNKAAQAKKKEQSLSLNYKFQHPKEKNQFEDLLLKEPSQEEPGYKDWHKEAMQVLMRRAVVAVGINLDLWDSVKKAKELADKEIKVIQQEAEYLKPGWGKTIFTQAQQLRQQAIAHQMKRQKELLAKQRAENNGN
eukprot:snap_masked-scaffold_33-processed-gene-2.34-mRNA-1 protein AED:1.00 eAED:1.00 QI:0/0/0/0/1/1/2/0/179